MSLIFFGFNLTAQTGFERQTIRLDTGWRFHLGHAGDPSKDFNFGISNIFAKSGKAEKSAIDPKFDDNSWKKVIVPHDWAVELPFVKSDNPDIVAHGFKPVGGEYPATSVGWYRNSILIPAADSGARFLITFDGIFRDARIWLNGFYLGNNESGYIGVTYDITDYVNFHKSNVLVVRVDATQFEGWFYEGAGIYRNVWLKRVDPLHFAEDGVFVYSELSSGQATIFAEAEVVNKYLVPVASEINFYLKDRTGALIASAKGGEIEVDPFRTGKVKASFKINNPHLWNLDDPWLYRLEAEILQEGVVKDRVAIPFGIRSIRFDAEKGFFLNGKNIKIMGVNCHQDHAGVGAAFPDYLHGYRIRLLKEMGVNAYRASHNPPAKELLDACDSLGMLVLDEHRLLNSSPEYLDQFERLIRRDRNHPSVFLWSVGNEEGLIQTTGIGKRITQTLLAVQKNLDPTRTSTYAADLPNVFTGINEVIPVRSFNYRQFAVADYHRDHPMQPILGTEMGSTVTTRGIYTLDSVRCYLPDQDITAPWWASRAEEWWPLCAAQPWWMGGFIWTGLDYRGEPTPFAWPNINSHFGVMDMCGFPKNLYYYYKSWWSGQDVIHISPHWNAAEKGKIGDTVEVWVNSNADEVELFLNEKSYGTQPMPRNGHLRWRVPYEPGIVKAMGTREGRTLESRVETTGIPVSLRLITGQKALKADGRDATVVNVQALDDNGRDVPDAGNLVTFTISGSGRILGAGNGDPSSHEPDKTESNQITRSLFNGKCQLILQAGKDLGMIIVSTSADGLKTETLSIPVLR